MQCCNISPVLGWTILFSVTQRLQLYHYMTYYLNLHVYMHVCPVTHCHIIFSMYKYLSIQCYDLKACPGQFTTYLSCPPRADLHIFTIPFTCNHTLDVLKHYRYTFLIPIDDLTENHMAHILTPLANQILKKIFLFM